MSSEESYVECYANARDVNDNQAKTVQASLISSESKQTNELTQVKVNEIFFSSFLLISIDQYFASFIYFYFLILY